MKMLYCRRISRTGMRPGSLEETLPINTAADEKTALSTIMVVDGAFFTCIFKAVDSLPFHTGVSNPPPVQRLPVEPSRASPPRTPRD